MFYLLQSHWIVSVKSLHLSHPFPIWSNLFAHMTRGGPLGSYTLARMTRGGPLRSYTLTYCDNHNEEKEKSRNCLFRVEVALAWQLDIVVSTSSPNCYHLITIPGEFSCYPIICTPCGKHRKQAKLFTFSFSPLSLCISSIVHCLVKGICSKLLQFVCTVPLEKRFSLASCVVGSQLCFCFFPL